MSALDAEFVHLEDGVNHLHIGACVIFEGPAPSEQEGREVFARALPLIPRYRQRLRRVPWDLGRPGWEDDPGFDLADHVFHTTLPEPGDDAALQELTADIMSRELDRRHPLWESWVVDGLTHGRWALICKVHHCLVDGVAGVDLMAVVLSDSPEVDESELPVDDWTPQPGPSDTRLVVESLGRLVQPTIATGRRLAGAALRPGDAFREVRTLVSGLGTLLGGARQTPPTPIHGTIGPERRWTWAHATLAETKAIREAHGGTVNDVILAAVTRGFRDLLETRGEDPANHEIHSLVPVSVRVEHGKLDNEVSALIADLPVRFSTPELRYEAIRTETERLKASSETEAGEQVTRLAELVPEPFLAYGSRVTAAFLRRRPRRNVTTVTTNVPGPQFPLYAAGRRMLKYYPFVPVAFGVRYAIAILSYDGDLYFGLTGDKECSPDLDVLAKGIEAGFAELVPDGPR